MKLHFFVSTVLAVLAATAITAFAHSESADTPDDGLDCAHPPKNIARKLPKDIAVAAAVLCTPASQLISAKDGWMWRYPASYFDRPSIPAYAPAPSRGQARGRYFTGFKATRLSNADVSALHGRFTETLATYSDRKAPARVILLKATNDLGHSLDAYFGFDSKDEGWVAVCAPTCAPEYFFLINRQQ